MQTLQALQTRARYGVQWDARFLKEGMSMLEA
jgi:hypothetical protein